MCLFKTTTVDNLNENFFEVISKEYMLITSGNKEDFNTMTANWGGVGFLWNRPVVFIFVRPERYTYHFIENNDYFTLSFLGIENKEIHKICGSKSGRDTDKIKETGLIPYETSYGNITFEQSRLTLECKKLYCEKLNKDRFLDEKILAKWYGDKGCLHCIYVAEIVQLLEKQ